MSSRAVMLSITAVACSSGSRAARSAPASGIVSGANPRRRAYQPRLRGMFTYPEPFDRT
jgi:hypothetical protein